MVHKQLNIYCVYLSIIWSPKLGIAKHTEPESEFSCVDKKEHVQQFDFINLPLNIGCIAGRMYLLDRIVW